jgi:hypothetical protein
VEATSDRHHRLEATQMGLEYPEISQEKLRTTLDWIGS